MREEYAIVLDIKKSGYGMQTTEKVILVGYGNFNLLETISYPGAELKIQEKVYIGFGKRDKIKTVKGILGYEKLTSFAEEELEYAIDAIISSKEDFFINFLNNMMPLTPKKHQCELLPGIGKKYMWNVIEERKKDKFKSFDDFNKRVALGIDIRKSIKKRIIQELSENDIKWRLFNKR
ncbi:MAG: DUF655 domain-containing protein [Candidatus Nanohalarchaeota archaeon]|nr:MAG: DUF655 domain-containing protein [Candidatus Nanohaloarchaeota archaeon]